jgi:Fe-S-cluster containining protein
MDAREVYRDLAIALRREMQRADAAEEALADLRARHAALVDLLIGKGILAASHRQTLDRAGKHGERPERPKVHLRVVRDKYEVGGADIDCAARIHACKARCCSFAHPLARQDLDEGVVMWNVTTPFQILQEADGYCTHIDRTTMGCTVHAQRPATCRLFDCRKDPRIWIDFDAMVPAP